MKIIEYPSNEMKIKKLWKKPTIKSLTCDEIKNIIMVSACSLYDPCKIFYFR